MDNYFINKSGDHWELKKQGATRASKVADTKQEMLTKTQSFMADKTASVKVRKKDGTFQEERTYQRKDDPRSTKG